MQLHPRDERTPVLTPDGQRVTPGAWAEQLGLFYASGHQAHPDPWYRPSLGTRRVHSEYLKLGATVCVLQVLYFS